MTYWKFFFCFYWLNSLFCFFKSAHFRLYLDSESRTFSGQKILKYRDGARTSHYMLCVGSKDNWLWGEFIYLLSMVFNLEHPSCSLCNSCSNVWLFKWQSVFTWLLLLETEPLGLCLIIVHIRFFHCTTEPGLTKVVQVSTAHGLSHPFLCHHFCLYLPLNVTQFYDTLSHTYLSKCIPYL